MQKRSKYRLQYAPFDLPEDFPFDLGGLHSQRDEPITRLHQHNALEIGICLDGSGIFVVEERVYPFGEGDVNVIGSEERHLARSAPGTISHWRFIALNPALLLGPQILEESLPETSAPGENGCPSILSARELPDFGRLIREIIAEAEGGTEGGRSMIRALVWQFMVRLRRLTTGRTARSRKRLGAMERISPALEHCAAHYSEGIAMEELACLCHTSLPSLRRLFHAAAGMSPLEYITNLRIQMATILLQESNSSILEIAGRVGYDAVSSFNRHFKRIQGESPRRWRNQKTDHSWS